MTRNTVLRRKAWAKPGVSITANYGGKESKMGTKIKKAATNAAASWKTTILGLAMGAAQIAMAATQAGAAGQSWTGANYMQAGIGVAMAAFGVLAKDSSVTGAVK